MLWVSLRVHKTDTGPEGRSHIRREVFSDPIGPSLKSGGLPTTSDLNNEFIEERASVQDPLVEPMEIQLVHGSKEVTGPTGPTRATALQRSQRAVMWVSATPFARMPSGTVYTDLSLRRNRSTGASDDELMKNPEWVTSNSSA